MSVNIILEMGNIPEDKEVVERLIDTNLEHKLSSYLKKYEGCDCTIKFHFEKNTRDCFNGKLHATLDADVYDFGREDYKSLEDLVNNLCKHLKEEISSK